MVVRWRETRKTCGGKELTHTAAEIYHDAENGLEKDRIVHTSGCGVESPCSRSEFTIFCLGFQR